MQYITAPEILCLNTTFKGSESTDVHANVKSTVEADKDILLTIKSHMVTIYTSYFNEKQLCLFVMMGFVWFSV